jgi:hypothetical protein
MSKAVGKSSGLDHADIKAWAITLRSQSSSPSSFTRVSFVVCDKGQMTEPRFPQRPPNQNIAGLQRLEKGVARIGDNCKHSIEKGSHASHSGCCKPIEDGGGIE